MNEKQMQDMAVSILLDEYTQLDVAQLLKEYDEAEENGDVPNIPDALDDACRRMIRRKFGKKKQTKILVRVSKVLHRAAIAVLVLIGICTTSVLSVKALREPALRFVLETFDRRSSVSIEGENIQKYKTPEEIIERLSQNLPKDYKLVHNFILDGHYQVRYLGTNGDVVELIVTAYRHGVYFDTENVDGKQMLINGYETILVEKSGYSIMWLDE